MAFSCPGILQKKIKYIEIKGGNMKITDSDIEQPVFAYNFQQDKEEILFFDIETTGLSPKTSSLYMIGAMFFDASRGIWHLRQLFADNYNSEAEIIISFLEILKKYNYLYHFNGRTFDIPYILNKCEKHNIKPDSHCLSILNDMYYKHSIDLLALIRPLKKLLSIPKAGQADLEKWLGINREDKYNGGQLISVYSQYMQYKIINSKKAAGLESLLFLHNHDDIKHMLDICNLLSYREIFSGSFDIAITNIAPWQSGQNKYINITFGHNVAIPKKITVTKQLPESRKKTIPANSILLTSNILLTLKEDAAILSVPLFYGNLKYFYPGYPASGCYSWKEGFFIPSATLQELKASSQFYITYKDKTCFYAVPGGIINKKNPFWENYVKLQIAAFIKTPGMCVNKR